MVHFKGLTGGIDRKPGNVTNKHYTSRKFF